MPTPLPPKIDEAVSTAEQTESDAVMATAPTLPASEVPVLAAVLAEAAKALGLVPQGEEPIDMTSVLEDLEAAGAEPVVLPEPVQRVLQALAAALSEARSTRVLTVPPRMDATDVRLLVGEIRAAMADPAVRSAMARPSQAAKPSQTTKPAAKSEPAEGMDMAGVDDLFARRMV